MVTLKYWEGHRADRATAARSVRKPSSPSRSASLAGYSRKASPPNSPKRQPSATLPTLRSTTSFALENTPTAATPTTYQTIRARSQVLEERPGSSHSTQAPPPPADAALTLPTGKNGTKALIVHHDAIHDPSCPVSSPETKPGLSYPLLPISTPSLLL
jgi:hypothetical protein